jgi:hypothetical protein
VRPFPPGPGGEWQISTGGGMAGAAISFRSVETKKSSFVKAGAAFQPGLAQELFQTRLNLSGSGTVAYRYAVSADGKRFLLLQPLEEAASTPITVVLNWAAGGKQ